MGVRKTGKIHPEKPHRNSEEGGEGKTERERERQHGKEAEKLENVSRSRRQIETREMRGMKVTHQRTHICMYAFFLKHTSIWYTHTNYQLSLDVMKLLGADKRRKMDSGRKRKHIQMGEIVPLFAMQYSSANTYILSLQAIIVAIRRQKSPSSSDNRKSSQRSIVHRPTSVPWPGGHWMLDGLKPSRHTLECIYNILGKVVRFSDVSSCTLTSHSGDLSPPLN